MAQSNFSFVKEHLPDYFDLVINAESLATRELHLSITCIDLIVEKLVSDLFLSLQIQFNSIYLSELVLDTNFKKCIGSSRINHYFKQLSIALPIAKNNSQFGKRNIQGFLKMTHALLLWFVSHNHKDFVLQPFVDSIFLEIESSTVMIDELRSMQSEIYTQRVTAQKNTPVLTKSEINTLRCAFSAQSSDHPIDLKSDYFVAFDFTGVTLNDFIYDINLTVEQKAFFPKFLNFLNSKTESVFILKGYAGTGKTFLMRIICNYLDCIDIGAVLAAPTSTAAQVLSEKTGKPTSTIHSLIYEEFQPVITEEEHYEKDLLKRYFQIKDNDLESNIVYIIDEASMISDTYSNNSPFLSFGSGCLFSDLVDFIGCDAPNNMRKIILVGDDAQLPPINQDGNESVALMGDYISMHFDLKVATHQLSQVVRQNTQSGILDNATYLRNVLKTQIYPTVQLSINQKDVIRLSSCLDNKLFDQYFNHIKYPGVNSVILAHSNKSVDEHNTFIHNLLFPNCESLCAGEKIAVWETNYFHQVQNGTKAWVKAIENRTTTHKVVFRDKPGSQATHVDLVFRKITIQIRNRNSFELLLLENFFYAAASNKGNLNFYKKALMVDFKNRFKEDFPEEKIGGSVFKRAMSSDPYFNALFAKFGYAQTIHKAQGSEWDNVFLDFPKRTRYCEETIRLIYTAVTRAKQKLYLMNITADMIRSNSIEPEREFDYWQLLCA